jgi:hypothetical protein
LIRNLHQSEHGDEGALPRYITKQIDRDLLNEFMRACSTDEQGFIIYLKQSATEYLEKNQPPPVITLSQIKDIISSDIDNDNESDGSIIDETEQQGKKRVFASKQLLARAKMIANTSKAVLKNITNGKYQGHTGKSFNYHSKVINSAEAAFYTQNNTIAKVLSNYADHLPEVFEWIPQSALSTEFLNRREVIKLQEER